jgi:signal transduction histidine kinase
LALILLPSAVTAQPSNQFRSSQTPQGPVIEFADGDYILAQGLESPKSGWERLPTPNIYRQRGTDWKTGDFRSLVGRFRFDRSALGNGPLALFTVSTRNQFAIYINGAEVGRNYARPDDQIAAWYRPYLVTFPSDKLRPGMNEVEIRVISQDAVGVGRVVIGPHLAIRDYYRTQFFWQITAPLASNFAMFVLGLLALLFWLGRRQEVELLWLSLSTVLWYLRNYQYFAEFTPFNLVLFNAVTVYATYFASVATAAFYFSFIKLPHRGRLVTGLFILGIPLVLAHAWFSASNLVFYIPTTMLIFGVALLAIIDLIRQFNLERGVLALAMLTPPISSFHDMAIAGWYQGWNGNGFYLSVFGGLLYSIAFLISFGKRALDAFGELGAANERLEQRVAETRAELAVSEAARQELVVAGALTRERERLMQEMHDGIGSNLITALAVARQQAQPDSTIRTLNRALADLKITVDSLEPVEGDIVALIGNLRHRMAGDLRDAGVSCKWEVEPCGLLHWLDAPNALHVLRIFQEAIGNVLTHSGADEMRIGCYEKEHDGVAGVATFVADNGQGFDRDAALRGKGLSNIRARAKSLHGTLDHESAPGKGTVVRLWLPYARATPVLTDQ